MAKSATRIAEATIASKMTDNPWRLSTVIHRPVIRREDERATIGPDLSMSPEGKCSCLPRSSSLPRRELSLWSLRRPGSFKLMVLLQWRVQRRWWTARQVTARPQLTDRPQWTARPQVTAQPQLTAWPGTALQATAQPVTARQATWRPGGRPGHSWFIWQLSSSLWWPGGVGRSYTSTGGGNGRVGRPWNLALPDILSAAFWRSSGVFQNSYLRDMTCIAEGMFTLGPVVVAQQVVDPGHLDPPS